MAKERGFRCALLPYPSQQLMGRRTDGNEIPQQGYSQAEQGPVACAGVVGADGHDIGRRWAVAVVMVLMLDPMLVGVFRQAMARIDMVVPGLAVCVVVVGDGAQQACCQHGKHDTSQESVLRRREHH